MSRIINDVRNNINFKKKLFVHSDLFSLTNFKSWLIHNPTITWENQECTANQEKSFTLSNNVNNASTFLIVSLQDNEL